MDYSTFWHAYSGLLSQTRLDPALRWIWSNARYRIRIYLRCDTRARGVWNLVQWILNHGWLGAHPRYKRLNFSYARRRNRYLSNVLDYESCRLPIRGFFWTQFNSDTMLNQWRHLGDSYRGFHLWLGCFTNILISTSDDSRSIVFLKRIRN